MPQNLLTERTVKSAKPQVTEYSISDGDGLELRIRPTASKTWRLRLMKDKRLVKKTLGTYPAISLAKARELAQDARTAVHLGKDVNSITDKGAPKLLDQLFTKWYEDYILVTRKNVTDQRSIKSRYMKHVHPTLGQTRLPQLRRGDFTTILDGLVKQGSRRQANMLLADSRQMLTYAALRDWIQGDPTAGLKAKNVGGKKKRSKRFLSEDELRDLKRILREPVAISKVRLRSCLPIRTELAVWLSLSTLARSVEVASVRAEDVDLKSGLWSIPEEICKNDTPHLIHLNAVSKEIFGILLSMQSESYLFPGRRGRAHIQETAFTRELTDRQGREKPLKGRRNSKELVLAGGKWTLHDLRRTGSTMMGEMGFSKELIDLCLNHKEEDEVTATYQLQVRLPERKEAFEALGIKLCEILDGAGWLPKPAPHQSANQRTEAQALQA